MPSYPFPRSTIAKTHAPAPAPAQLYTSVQPQVAPPPLGPLGAHFHQYAPGGPVTHNNHYYAAPAPYFIPPFGMSTGTMPPQDPGNSGTPPPTSLPSSQDLSTSYQSHSSDSRMPDNVYEWLKSLVPPAPPPSASSYAQPQSDAGNTSAPRQPQVPNGQGPTAESPSYRQSPSAAVNTSPASTTHTIRRIPSRARPPSVPSYAQPQSDAGNTSTPRQSLVSHARGPTAESSSHAATTSPASTTHTIRRVPVRYGLADIASSHHASVTVTDMHPPPGTEAAIETPPRLRTFPEVTFGDDRARDVSQDAAAAVEQNEAVHTAIDLPTIVVQSATEPSPPLSPAASSTSSSPWSPPASIHSTPPTSAHSTPPSMHTAALHDVQSSSSLTGPPVGELAGRILSQMTARAAETSSSSVHEYTHDVHGRMDPIEEVEEDLAEEEIDGEDPEEPLSLTYRGTFTLTVPPRLEPKSYDMPKQYVERVLALRREFNRAHDLPSHPAIDIQTYDAHAALALESRLSQDSKVAQALKETVGRIAYNARMNDEDGTERLWRLTKVEAMLEERRERMLEIDRWRRAS